MLVYTDRKIHRSQNALVHRTPDYSTVPLLLDYEREKIAKLLSLGGKSPSREEKLERFERSGATYVNLLPLPHFEYRLIIRKP